MTRTSLALSLLAVILSVAPAQKQYEPKIAAASEDGRRQMAGFQIDKAFEAKLFAAEPMLANPVCLWVDAKGRVFIGETFRQEQGGVPDNRSFSFWRDDDLKNQTLADRRSMYLTHRPHYAQQFTEHHDRIVRLEDRDGDGVADRSVVYADGFNDILDGTGAGILTRGSDLYYTCIPNLWKLTDSNDDGKVDRREILHTGYGIRIALRGHDLHGLVMGPDGRLYFSIGDRGYNIHTAEGQHLKCPWSGAVFRCELDGSNLEVFATGLRNPQELAFDDYGNLFTGDNNSDSEDKARIVYVVEGGETGWRMNFQYRGDRGGWVSEGWWKTRHEGQAAFLIPPLAHLGSGPSGFTSYPGTGLPKQYDGTFLMCDFRGGRRNSGIRSLKFEPDGAGFKVVETGQLLWSCLATDVDFGPDGTLFVSDWVSGWTGPGKGRVYTFRHKDAAARAAGDETARLLSSDWKKRDLRSLSGLLAHRDRRVRLEAQYELVARGSSGLRVLVDAAVPRTNDRMARIHGLWGIGQIARTDPAGFREALDVWGELGLASLTLDDDDEVRAQAVRVLGELDVPDVMDADDLTTLLTDRSPRVRYFAAMNLGRIGGAKAVTPLMALVRENDDEDPFLRHACIMGLTRIADENGMAAHVNDASSAARLAAVLTLRRLKSPRVAEFLRDADGYVATAAARAIYDVPIMDAFPALASALGASPMPSLPFARRAVCAAEQIAEPAHVSLLAAFVTRADVPEEARAEAMAALTDWNEHREFERILNMYRDRPAAASPAKVVSAHIAGLLESAPSSVRRQAVVFAVKHGLKDHVGRLLAIVEDKKADVPTRIEALKGVAELSRDDLQRAVDLALASGNTRLRAEVAALLPRISKDLTLHFIAGTFESGSTEERQAGIRTLANMKTKRADEMLSAAMDRLLAGEQPPETWLELLEAAKKRGAHHGPLKDRLSKWQASLSADDPIAKYRAALRGGNARRGRRIFLNKTETSCRRCHQVGNLKPTDPNVMAGPDLSSIGSEKDREYLLRAIVAPNAEIAAQFQDWLVETRDDDVYRGRILSENDEELVIEVKEFGEDPEKVTVKKSEITFRKRENSSMPEDLITKLDSSELRDLIEFLASQKAKRK